MMYYLKKNQVNSQITVRHVNTDSVDLPSGLKTSSVCLKAFFQSPVWILVSVRF